MEKIFSNYICDEQPNLKMAKDLTKHFMKEDIRMANNDRERYSASLIIMKMQVKTTIRYHYTPCIMAVIKDR